MFNFFFEDNSNANKLHSFSSRQFKRVLELPSENWLELAQDWCCHGSSHLTSVAGALEPGENDCFVGEHYIKMHPATVATDNLQILPVS